MDFSKTISVKAILLAALFSFAMAAPVPEPTLTVRTPDTNLALGSGHILTKLQTGGLTPDCGVCEGSVSS